MSRARGLVGGWGWITALPLLGGCASAAGDPEVRVVARGAQDRVAHGLSYRLDDVSRATDGVARGACLASELEAVALLPGTYRLVVHGAAGGGSYDLRLTRDERVLLDEPGLPAGLRVEVLFEVPDGPGGVACAGGAPAPLRGARAARRRDGLTDPLHSAAALHGLVALGTR